MSTSPSPPGRELVVQRRYASARQTVAFELANADGLALPDWAPGSHIDVVLPLANGELVRQYSLCGPVDNARLWRIVVHRERHGRGGSAYLCDQLVEGQRLYVRGPRNNFPFVPSPRLTLLAGGIGITALLPMVAAAQDAGCDWRLLYLARSQADMSLLDEICRLPPERVTLHCSADRGRLDLAAWTRTLGPEEAVFACGPLRLLDDLESLHDHTARWQLHLERFENPNFAQGEHRAFEVVLARSGRSVRVNSEESILDALLREGLALDCSCREGVCGSCEQRVLQGVPDHRDAVLTADERRQNTHMMICVSRATTPTIMLDL
ncbi:MAG: PDR/VanB family oxidoreductase [Rhodoferax sp.]|nr:PDR/VanB family oxidoreductase [Rhodoferax sp.]